LEGRSLGAGVPAICHSKYNECWLAPWPRIWNFDMGLLDRAKRLVIGGPRDVEDPGVYRKISLVAILAWVGLGADGLTSSAYGPDEAFRVLLSAGHPELGVFLAAATALTVFVISYAYSRVIEHFPSGGGGYAVASQLLGPPVGVVSGGALLIDYVLTIAVSITSGADQLFSFLPLSVHGFKMPVIVLAVAALVLMNLRGVKESITLLAPVFLLFVGCHLALFLGLFVSHAGTVAPTVIETSSALSSGWGSLGAAGMLVLLARSFAQGAGTYTGIEAVANGIPIMREPKVQTAKRTMAYMAASLAVTAGGILIGYLLLQVTVQEGKTLNAVLLDNLGWGKWFMVLTLVSEAALLTVAAQTGFIDGPRVMSNMALDSWLPHRFSSLSERLVLHDGVLIIGVAALAVVFYAQGDIVTLVTMYSINVFITFTLTEIGMVRFSIRDRRRIPGLLRALPIHVVGLVLCVGVLSLLIYEKFFQGAWLTLVVTFLLIVMCFLIRRYYRHVREKFLQLAQQLEEIPAEPGAAKAKTTLSPEEPVAALLVGGYGGLGLHSILAIQKLFPHYYGQVLFISVAVLDSGHFKGIREVDQLKDQTEGNLSKYVVMANRLGIDAASMMGVGTDPVEEAETLCVEAAKRYPKITFFAGQLIFQREAWYQRILHNDTAFAIQRRLQWRGLATIILPIRAR
jgi:amino acid transporter